MLSQIWFKVQTKLFPFLAEVMGTLSEKQKRLVAILEVARVEEFVERECGGYRGRPKEDRRALARAFIAKMVYDEKTTSASVHDSQAAIPLAKMSFERVDSLYDLMDAAYDANEIKDFSRSLGHVPIIDQNRRKGTKEEIDPAQQQRYNERSTAERGFSMLKENFGGRNVRVKGHIKVFAHLMFGIVALTADRLLNLVT
jgi:transposase